VQHGWIRIPAADVGRTRDAPFAVHDLLTDVTYTWRGEWNYVRLDPGVLPAHVLSVKA
jgi:starch synthase (maltosyl-transferring)